MQVEGGKDAPVASIWGPRASLLAILRTRQAG